jgi:hypothetical protein
MLKRIEQTRILVFTIVTFICVLKTSDAFAQASGAGDAGASSNFRYEVTLSGGYLGLSTSSGQINLAPAFYFKPLRSDLLQVGGELGYQKTSHQGGSASNLDVLGGIAINIGNLSSAFYCMMGVALKGGSGGAGEDTAAVDPNGVGYHFLCGKRIPIGGNPSWVFKPSVGVIAGGTSGMVFRPLAISFLF